MPAPIPTQLGRHQILDEIGRGAMGVVYLAKDPLIGRLVALKTFRISTGAQEQDLAQFRRRFIREAQSAGILSHPNIVTIHDVVEDADNGSAFIAMEYVRGTNLKELLKRPEPFDLSYVADIVWQVAEALEYAHSKGVVHRDVKPANILITSDNRVKLTDFGIARMATSELTQVGQLLGTPNYMSPEQVKGQDVDQRSDIFSVGVVLYEMLTRRKPFRGKSLTEVSQLIVNEPFTPPEDHIGPLPDGLKAILDKALAKSPEQRFQRVGELALQLKKVADSFAAESKLSETQEIEVEELASASGSGAVSAAPAAPAESSAAPPVVPLSQRWAQTALRLRDTAAVWGETLRAKIGLGGSDAEPQTAAAAAAAPTQVLASGAAQEAEPRGPRRAVPLRRLALVALGTLGLALLTGALAFRAVSSEETSEVTDPQHQLRLEYGPLLQEGHRQLGGGDPVAALVSFRQAERLAPGRSRIRFYRQEAERQALAMTDDAIRLEILTAALEDGRVALEERRYGESVVYAQRALELDPENEEAQALLADAEAAQDRDRRAEARRRARAEEQARQEALAAAQEEAAAAAPAEPEVVAEPEPEPILVGDSTISLDFYSELSDGVLTVYSGASQLFQREYRFGQKRRFRPPKPTPGGFGQQLTLEPGGYSLRIWVTSEKIDGGRSAVVPLTMDLAPGTSYQLDIRLDEEGKLTASLR